MWKVPLTTERKGSKEQEPENAENVETKMRKNRKMRMTGFNVTAFR